MAGNTANPFTVVTRLVVLSPHLDDTALSCGAATAAAASAGTDVVSVTVFDGEPQGQLSAAAREFHHACGLGDDAMSHRRAEDDAALARLGVVPVRLGLAEALYRRDAAGDPRYPGGQDIFGPGFGPGCGTAADDPGGDAAAPDPYGLEPDVVAEVARRLTSLPAVREAELLLAPLAVGGHVDHRITAAAARQLDRPLLWYEDIPYALFDRCRGWQKTLRPAGPFVHRASTADWAAKLDAIDCYVSQHPVLWEEPDRRRQVLTAYGTSVGADAAPAERYWRDRG
ncbi:PIG-L family deacetylase [Streptomyces sp. NBC_01210]|uniref:PIG-L deacetylase family protein n=1 Tax=Streptomyces sp. NBC_01210 TaxID=2903774 RepID=UPI002E134468|nr:PIG-L family deacetylase [Streptomyces sp. NBC_01210]